MKRILGICMLFLVAQWAMATHIVGGEFEITHVNGDYYLFRQIQYFDVVNGEPLAKDQEIRASVFRKRDNLFVRTVTMRYRTESLVQYTNPLCTNSRLITNRIEYATEVRLDSASFSDPEGYYMVWERCCRNRTITNIVLPDQTGQTFYLEFPAIRKNGEPFRNSSPQLFPPLSDYACVNRLYYVDFRGTDPDGDSLVYSLNPPLNCSRFEPLPIPTPAPHDPVTWRSGISDNYQVPGNPTLTINDEGFLTVVPSQEGLFVFSVKCEEYRDGQKIGEVLRDFQLYVIDCPDPGNNPELQVKTPDATAYVSAIDTIRLKPGDNHCFDFRVKDKDGGETIKLRARSVNFKENVQSILSSSIGFLPGTEDTLAIRVCLPECPYVQGKPYIIDIIAEDNTCPLPLMDTLRMIVVVEPPPNKPPSFVLPIQEELNLSVFEGDTIDLEFLAIDPDGDQLKLLIDDVMFELETFGIVIDTIENAEGNMNFRFWWDTDCSKYPFANKNDFQLKFYVDDDDLCNRDNRDSVIVNVHVELPANNVPKIFVAGKSDSVSVVVVAGANVLLDVEALDADINDLITVSLIGTGFEKETAGIEFNDVSGKQKLAVPFEWTTYCELLTKQKNGQYNMMFVVEDADKCKVPNADSLMLKVTVVPPPNTAPILLVNGEAAKDTLWVNAGEEVNLEISGKDTDSDSLSLKLMNRELVDEIGASFSDINGFGNIITHLDWQTDCSALSENFQNAFYNFTFTLQDYVCAVPKQDTREIIIAVKDAEVEYNFFMPNVFTPNAEDTINETFFAPALPRDNCERQFKRVTIFNRWGSEVFHSTDRNFHWTGENYATGVYYYVLSFTGVDVKGTISLLR